MAFLPQVFTVPTMVTGASITGSLELPGAFLYMYLEVPGMGGMSASTPIYIQGSSDNVTFRRFSNPEVNTSTVGANDFSVVSSVSNRMVQIPNFAMRYMKVEISGTATTPTSTFKVIAVSNQ